MINFADPGQEDKYESQSCKDKSHGNEKNNIVSIANNLFQIFFERTSFDCRSVTE